MTHKIYLSTYQIATPFLYVVCWSYSASINCKNPENVASLLYQFLTIICVESYWRGKSLLTVFSVIFYTKNIFIDTPVSSTKFSCYISNFILISLRLNINSICFSPIIFTEIAESFYKLKKGIVVNFL